MKIVEHHAIEQYSDPTPTQLVSKSKYYGVDFGGVRGFVARTEYGRGPHVILSMNAITKGNGWPEFTTNSLADTINKVRSKNNHEVFEFDSAVELLTWLKETL